MGFLPVALAAGGAGLKAYGSYEEGQAVAKEAKYNAAVQENNAAYASAAGQSQAEVESLKDAAGQGHLKAAQGANNIDVNSGSAVKVQEGARAAGEIDAANVENNALLQAYGYKQEAALQRNKATQAQISGDIGAVGSLLEGAQSVGGKWADMAGPAAAAGG